MNNCNIIILTFIVTGIWDIILRLMAENYNKIPKLIRLKFVKNFIEYFKTKTVLGAALIAGFVGGISQTLLLYFFKFPRKIDKMRYIIIFLLYSFLLSALIGYIMVISGLFPDLVRTYYNKLGFWEGRWQDGESGLIVQITVLVIYFLSSII